MWLRSLWLVWMFEQDKSKKPYCWQKAEKNLETNIECSPSKGAQQQIPQGESVRLENNKAKGCIFLRQGGSVCWCFKLSNIRLFIFWQDKWKSYGKILDGTFRIENESSEEFANGKMKDWLYFGGDLEYHLNPGRF